jgi:AmmeMemoRadiSam system protein B
LGRMVDELLGRKVKTKACAGALVPHAGLRFSGKVAAAVLKRIVLPSTVIILGPKHTPHGADWAVAPHETWDLPGFQIASDLALARRLAEAIPGLELDAAAHQHEHAIEVELPFIARRSPETKVVGVVLGPGDFDSCMQFADGLVKVVQECDEPPLLLVSSDMNHFAGDDENRRLDDLALDALETLEPRKLYEVVTDNDISMCGVLPAVIVLETLRRLGRLKKAEQVAYATSADTTGDTNRVVGYAGVLLS